MVSIPPATILRHAISFLRTSKSSAKHHKRERNAPNYKSTTTSTACGDGVGTFARPCQLSQPWQCNLLPTLRSRSHKHWQACEGNEERRIEWFLEKYPSRWFNLIALRRNDVRKVHALHSNLFPRSSRTQQQQNSMWSCLAQFAHYRHDATC